MSPWWWVPIGLAAWFGVALAAGLLLSRFFRRTSQTRDALDAQEKKETLAGREEPPQDGPRVA